MRSDVVAVVRDSQRSKLRPPTARPSRWYPAALFVILSGAYFTIGSILILRYNVFDGDGLSRVANAGYITMSRNPHLSAIGFVWNPLPSLVEIPLMPLTRWWPELKTHGLAGSLQSAMFMGGSALMIRRIALDRSVGTAWRWIAVGCFAINPMVVLNGGFGLSEAAAGFCILWCVRYLLLWIDAGRAGDLAWAGIALGVGYLARYEALPAVVGVAALVAVVAQVRSVPPMRTHSTIATVVIVTFPTAVALALWAVSGWIVSGDLFATISSVYGNASQVATAHQRGGDTSFNTGNWRLITALVLAMQPFAGIAVGVAAIVATRTRTVAPVIPIVAFGSMLAFVVWGQYSGSTFNLFRYYMPAISMVLVIALTCWRPATRRVGWWRVDSVATKLGAALLCASTVIGIPVTTRSMFSSDIGIRQQLRGVTSLLASDDGTDPEKYRRVGEDDRLVADYLDRRDLPAGSVLMDTFTSWLIWLASAHSQQFVITSDYDFTTALNRPWDYGIRYIVVSNPGSSATNAIQLRYPAMWADGAGIGELVYSVDDSTGQKRWRIYRVFAPLQSGPPSPKLAQSGR